MMPRVAVVTVTYNTGETLRPLLASIPRASSDPVVTVVSDNGSSDVDLVRSISLENGASFVVSGRNLGYGGGVRHGLSTVTDPVEFVLVTNPDVVLGDGAIDRLVEAAERLPRAGSLGPKIIDETGVVYPSARRLPSLRTGIGHAAFSRLWPGNPWSQSYWAARETAVERTAGWLSGACVLVRRSAFDEIGGFDEGYFMYFEDVDLGARLGRAGWDNVFVPTAVVMHSGAHSTSGSAKTMERVHHDSAYRYLSRRYRGPILGPLRAALKVGLRVRSWWVTR
ncbi:N-acetylglucosaminyl-diphospho-decaprenol L-rhamnosyltransferase [Frigoribacterium sp. 9N]|nr:N-acetylglucosaminyl-diphospho-decaprenol L-rhamnosyltransferase [Frigoribacterium sp. 9N]